MPAEQTADRVTRMLAMMGYLAENDSVPVADLATHFGVSESQVLRDIDLLWVTGAPGYYPDDLIDFSVDDFEDNIISLRDAQGLNRPVPLAPREALALAAAVAWLRSSGVATPATEAVLTAVQAKLQGVTKAEVDVVDGGDATKRACLLQAIEGRGAVRIEYVSAEDRRSERVIEPQGLYTDGNAWYVDAWCHVAGGRRTFRVDRMLAVTEAPRPATRDTAPTDLPEVEVVLVLDPSARWLADELPDVTARNIMNGGRPAVELRLTVTRTDWLVRRLLALGSGVRAVGPPALRDELVHRARAALAAYDRCGT